MKVIKVCRCCYGYEPCLCNEHKYIEMYEFVYEAMKRTKGA